jgi:hypothetical protein
MVERSRRRPRQAARAGTIAPTVSPSSSKVDASAATSPRSTAAQKSASIVSTGNANSGGSGQYRWWSKA